MTIKNFGHCTFLFDIGGYKILTDPFISGHPKSEFDTAEISCDLMLLSHGHQDHILDAVSIAKNTNCKVIANFEICNWLEKKGVSNLRAVNHGGNTEFPGGTVKMVNAIHSSSFPDGTYAGNPAGFIIKTAALNVYFSGDTALMMDMKIFGEHENLSVALLPIGDTFTMGIDDAIIASKMLDCSKIIGMHYDTFPPIVIDKESAIKKFKTEGFQLDLLELGQTKEY